VHTWAQQVFDTIALTAGVRAWLDELTRGGELIEAVVATHPFHTLYFAPFHAIYPNVRRSRAW
jgi:hypothetical protein